MFERASPPTWTFDPPLIAPGYQPTGPITESIDDRRVMLLNSIHCTHNGVTRTAQAGLISDGTSGPGAVLALIGEGHHSGHVYWFALIHDQDWSDADAMDRNGEHSMANSLRRASNAWLSSVLRASGHRLKAQAVSEGVEFGRVWRRIASALGR